MSFDHLDEVRAARRAGLDESRTAAAERQHTLGKLTARERLDELCDVGSFDEIGGLVAPTRDTSYAGTVDAPADGVVMGRASIDGRAVAIASFDFTAAGGSNGVAGLLKLERLIGAALDDGCPIVMLLEGGGHRLQEGLDSWHFAAGSAVMAGLTDLSGWVPIVAVMVGPSFGGPTNFASAADLVVMVRHTSSMGMAGPPLVRAATGEVVTKEELGGADVQAGSGVADLAVDTEREAFDAVRLFLSYLPRNSGAACEVIDHFTEHPRAGDVHTIVPTNPRQAYDVLDVVEALADEHTVFELKPMHARNVVTALARFGGRPVGVIANQPNQLSGALDSPACEKAAHFISLCDAFGLALVYLIDVPGFLAGSGAERSQLARRSGRMFFELGQATVPRLSVVLRKGYGAAYVAMCGGRSYRPDLAVAWPTAEISAMSIDGALDVAYQHDIEAAPDRSARRAELHAEFAPHISPLAAARGFGIDDVVEPGATRRLLVSTLRRLPHRRQRTGPPKAHAISPI